MAKSTYNVAYRRKLEGKTDYHKRLSLLQSKMPRAVIRKSNKNIIIQGVEMSIKGDKVILSAHTNELKKLGWKGPNSNTTASYLCGLLFARKAKEKKIKKLIADIGMHTSTKQNNVYAAIKGINDGGVEVPVAKEIVPEEKRIKGEHIAQYAKQLKANKEKYQKQFSAYIKSGLEPEQMPKHFEELKKKISQ